MVFGRELDLCIQQSRPFADLGISFTFQGI